MYTIFTINLKEYLNFEKYLLIFDLERMIQNGLFFLNVFFTIKYLINLAQNSQETFLLVFIIRIYIKKVKIK